MSPSPITVLAYPYFLFIASLTSLLISRLIITHVKHHGPIPIFRGIIRHNSIIYSVFSLLLCLGITYSIFTDSHKSKTSLHSLICSTSTSGLDKRLRYIYHGSKIYEYVDIFNVLAVGGVVNANFLVHYFTMMYLTYSRVLLHPTGWQVFAFLNTLHHAFMYVYFGGATLFSGILPVTGILQLAVGILGELYVLWSGCGEVPLWANCVALGLLGTYAVLFAGDLRERAKGKVEEKKRAGEKVE